MTEQVSPSVAQDTNSYFGISYPESMGDDFVLSMRAGTEQSINFAILNRGGFQVRAQITREVASAVMAGWFPDNAIQEHAINIGETFDYSMTINIPEDAPAGDYAIQLEIVDLALPDETLTRSPAIPLRVEPAADFSIPTWLIVIAAVLVIAIVGVGIAAFVLSRQPPSGDIWLAFTRTGPPSNLFVRLPVEAGTVSDADAPVQQLTDNSHYAEFLNNQAEITQYAEYHPQWSPGGCELVYGASIEVGRYFLNPDETLYDLRSLLSISSEEMETVAGIILEYEALNEFLAANPAYAAAAIDDTQNPYLALAPTNTALVTYYQETSGRVSADFAARLYRHIASVFYNEIDRGTLYGLFQLNFEMQGEGDTEEAVARVELITWARLDSNARYIPANPTWTTLDNRDLIAFEFVQELQRSNSPAFIALHIDDNLYLLRDESLRSDDGFYYDRDPAWWSDGSERGLFFTSRHALNYDNLRQSQIYRLQLDIDALSNSADALVDDDVALPEVDFSEFVTDTPVPTLDPEATIEATAQPTLTPFPTLFAQVLQYTPVFTLTPLAQAEIDTGEVSPVPVATIAAQATQVQLLSFDDTMLENISSNSVNDSQAIALGRDSIIFVSDRDGAQPYESQHLYRLDFGTNADSTARRLTGDAVTVQEFSPALSENGNDIVYVRQTGRAPQLYTVNVFGEGGTTRITSSSDDFNSFPSWQPAPCPALDSYIESLEASS